MPWETYDPDETTRSVDDPRLTIYTTLSGRINASADSRFYEGHESVQFHVDAERGLLAIEPAGDDGDYQLSRGDGPGSGADLACKYALRDGLGIEEDDLDDTEFCVLEWDDEHGWAVADVSTLVDAAEETAESGTVETDTGDDGDSNPTEDGEDAEVAEESADDRAGADSDETGAEQAGEVPGPDVWAETYTSKPAVEQYVCDAFADDQHEFTVTEVAEDLDISASWTGRSFVQLVQSSAPIVFRDVDGKGDSNMDTTYTLEPTTDLAEALGIDGDGRDEARDEDEGDDGDGNEDSCWCGYCGAGPFQQGDDVEDHHDRESHPGDPVVRGSDPADSDLTEEPAITDDGDGDAAVPDPEDAVSETRVREAATSVETLSELAAELDVSEGEARLQARDAGVIDEIRDDRPRMGVGTDD